jgi:hypothetical protein
MVVSEVWLWEKEGKPMSGDCRRRGRRVRKQRRDDAAEPLLEARDPVGRRTDPARLHAEDSFYVDV